jgi:hypothetical protein
MHNMTGSKVSFATLAAAVALAGASLVCAQDTTQLHRLTVGKSPAGGIASTEPGHTWHLARFNKTDQIDAAYRYGDNVIIFGWAGLAGVATIIDAATGEEKLEFLGNDFRISPKGVIVFTRFYAHFADPSVVSDTVAELDLKGPIPHSVPSRETENPTDQVGLTIYPEAPTPGVRHDILYNFVVTDAGALLYLVDRLSSGKLCMVRLSLADSGGRLQKENCVTSEAFGASDFSEVHIRQLSENALGDLILALDIGKLPRPLQRDFHIDKTSLGLTAPPAQKEPGKPSDRPFSIPWRVQKRALTVFVPVHVDAHAQESAKVRLTIDTAGNVSDVSILGLPSDVAALVKGGILGWKFKPTVFPGGPVQVVTEFTSTIAGLANIPE